MKHDISIAQGETSHLEFFIRSLIHSSPIYLPAY